MTIPIELHVVRYQCPFCHRSRASRRATTEHIGRCWYNPAARSCKTCTNFEPATASDCGEPGCNGCGSDEFCHAGIDLNAERDERGLPLQCPKWEADS